MTTKAKKITKKRFSIDLPSDVFELVEATGKTENRTVKNQAETIIIQSIKSKTNDKK